MRILKRQGRKIVRNLRFVKLLEKRLYLLLLIIQRFKGCESDMALSLNNLIFVSKMTIVQDGK